MTDQPDRPTASAPVPPTGGHMPAIDAASHAHLAQDPACEDAKVDVGSDESFPASDPLAAIQPKSEIPPSTGFQDE